MAQYKLASISGDILDYFLVKAHAQHRTFGQQIMYELSLVMKKEQSGENVTQG